MKCYMLISLWNASLQRLWFASTQPRCFDCRIIMLLVENKWVYFDQDHILFIDVLRLRTLTNAITNGGATNSVSLYIYICVFSIYPVYSSPFWLSFHIWFVLLLTNLLFFLYRSRFHNKIRTIDPIHRCCVWHQLLAVMTWHVDLE